LYIWIVEAGKRTRAKTRRNGERLLASAVRPKSVRLEGFVNDGGTYMRADDFQWLANQVMLFFPPELKEQAIGILAEAQEALDEAEAAQQEIRELGEEFLRRKEGGKL
jgi:hypothetical protein